MSETCTGHDLPYSCVRTCAMHVQAALCLAAVFVLARCMYRPRSALQLCSHMRGACTGHALPFNCARICEACEVRALPGGCKACAAHAWHLRLRTKTRTWRRTRENARGGGTDRLRKRARGSGTDRLLPWLARSVPCCLHASIPQLATPNCGRSHTRVDLGT